MANIPGIDFSSIVKSPTMDSDYSLFRLPFYKDDEYFSNFDNYVYFIKACERMVRSSDDYKKYKNYLINELGLNVCQVLSNISTDDFEADGIEMHHGPILTLFDIISIIVDSEIAHGRKITTFSITDKCLEEHFENNVQVVMLSETVHQLVHDNGIFINMKQAFGNLNRFLTKYKAGLFNEQISIINEYIDASLKNDSTDNNVLKLRDTIKEWYPVNR